ncbi:MAG: tetratricopeptide repeat protein, partial [Planctomycetota bacterium]
MRLPLRRSDLLLGILLAAAALAAYWPALGSGFLAYDDPDTVLENPFVNDTSLSGLGRIWTSRVFLTWLPVYFSSLWLDHAIFGGNAVGFHVVNLLLHVLNALLVLALVRRIAGRGDVAWGVAFLFALHPAMTESVAWISERKGLLAFLFCALSFLSFLEAAERAGRARAVRHGLGALLLVLAMLAKGSALVLPLVLLLYVASSRWGERRAAWLLDVAPYVVVATALAGVHYVIAIEEGPALAAGDASTLSLLVTGLPVLAGYLRTLFLPIWGQSLVHDVQPVAGLELRAIVGAAVAAALVAALVVAYRRDRIVFFGLATAAVALAPFNNVLPRTTVLFAERYLYFSGFGAALVLGVLLSRAHRRAWMPIAAAAGALMILTFARSSLWSDGVEVFADAEAKAEGSWLASTKHADALKARGRWTEAEAALRRALSRAAAPLEETATRLDLSGILLRRGSAAEALEVLEPVPAGVAPFALFMNRGLALSDVGRHEEACEDFRAAAREEPGEPGPLANLCSSLARAGDLPAAREAGEEAVRLGPADESAAVALAEVLVLLGERQEARRRLVAVAVEDRPLTRARCLLGEIELELARPRAARKQFERVLADRPDHPRAVRGLVEAELLLARAALDRGERDVARGLVRSAAGRAPGSPGPWLFLAALAEDPGEVERLLTKAAGLPGGEPARDRLGSFRIRRALARAAEGDEEGAARLAAAALRSGARALSLGSRLEVRAELPRLRVLPD